MQLFKVKYCSKLDVQVAYNLVRMALGEEWKTTFQCRLGNHEYKVMTFGLTNARPTFQYFLNDTIQEQLDIFCTALLMISWYTRKPWKNTEIM